jgi:hypothetical protein
LFYLFLLALFSLAPYIKYHLGYPIGIVLPLGLKPVQAGRWVEGSGDGVGTGVRLMDKFSEVNIEFLSTKSNCRDHVLTVRLWFSLLKVHSEGLQVWQCLPKWPKAIATVVTLQPLCHLVWRLKKVYEVLHVVLLILCDCVSEWAVIELVVISFMVCEPADKAVGKLAELVAAEEHKIDAVPANAIILTKI